MLKQLRGIVQAVVSKIGGRLSNQRLIFELSAPDFPAPDAAFTITSHIRPDSIPRTVLADMESADRNILITLRQRFSENGRLYVLTVADGRLGSFMWVKSGRDIKRWMIPLRPADWVIFGAFTPQHMRGRKLWPHAMRAAYQAEQTPDGRCFSDCGVYNAPSRSALLRQGFRVIAKAPVPAAPR